MLVVDIYELYDFYKGPRIISPLGWAEKERKIVILRGKRIGKQILKERFLDKRYGPKELRYVEAKQGKAFIENLPYALRGSYVWAGKARKRWRNE